MLWLQPVKVRGRGGVALILDPQRGGGTSTLIPTQESIVLFDSILPRQNNTLSLSPRERAHHVFTALLRAAQIEKTPLRAAEI